MKSYGNNKHLSPNLRSDDEPFRRLYTESGKPVRGSSG